MEERVKIANFVKKYMMDIQQGDKVKFLNDIGGGTVTAIIDKDKVLVSGEDGFETPVLIRDLILTERKKQEIIQPPVKTQSFSAKDFEQADTEENLPIIDEVVVFALQLKNNSEIFSYLINVSTYHLFYTVSVKKESEMLLLGSGKLEPDTKVGVSRIANLNMDENMVIHINVLFFGKSFYKYVQPVNRKVEILPSDLYSGILLKENEYLDENAAIFTVYSFKAPDKDFTNTKIDNRDELKKHFEGKDEEEIRAIPKKSVKSENITEVDLHIQHIVEDYERLTSGEIVEIQMARFKTSLDTALIHKTRKIVFIHGVGNGKLKFEIRKSLEKDYADLVYQDASFKEYGYGATMVLIPQ
ncbi:MAG: DUF2027 domain-containing protein [Bacteroidales bacterium]|nr:DUF2027 domain-containing protein [Bacteroidales bacterium]